jgi:SAM-dependent methyltransferase
MTTLESHHQLDETITHRIDSEKRYHETFYKRSDIPLRVNFDLATAAKRKVHNLVWAYYDRILDHFHRDIADKRILVVGCGTGLTALNLAKNGALVDAFDVSDEAIAICRRRAAHNLIKGVNFFVSSCEELHLTWSHYDAVVGEMILHHIDIPLAVDQFHRYLKEGGLGVFAEWKEYPVIDHIRSTRPFRRLFPPGGVNQYATEYERKLSKEDFEVIRRRFPDMCLDYRYCIRGKIGYFSESLGGKIEKLDYWILRKLPVLKYFTDGVIIRFTKVQRTNASP